MNFDKRSLANQALRMLSSGGFSCSSVVLLTVLCFLITFGSIVMYRGAASKSWPTAEGNVISSSVEPSHEKDANGNDITYYRADVRYEYTVAGQKYASNRISALDYGSNQAHADAIVNRYPAGSNVTVHYAPEHPENSLLETGVTWSISLPLLFTLPILLLCLGRNLMGRILRNVSIIPEPDKIGELESPVMPTSNEPQVVSSNRFLYVIMVIFIVISCMIIPFGVKMIIEANASKTWPTAEGKIISSTVAESISQNSQGNNQTTYSAKVIYEYAFSGRTYTSSKVSFGDYGSSSPNHANNIVDRYPAGSHVLVHFAPAAPETSVLETGITWSTFFPLICSIPFLIVGIAGIRALRKGQWSQTIQLPNKTVAPDSTELSTRKEPAMNEPSFFDDPTDSGR